MCVHAFIHIYAPIQRPEEDVRCSALSLSTLFSCVWSLTEPRPNWTGGQQAPELVLFLSLIMLSDSCAQTCLLFNMEAGDYNSGPCAYKEKLLLLPTEPSPQPVLSFVILVVSTTHCNLLGY